MKPESINDPDSHAVAGTTDHGKVLLAKNDEQVNKITAGDAIELDTSNDIDYMTIEGMKSQEYSIGIFIFMVFGILVFLGIITQFILHARKNKTLKRGELVMFIWIILGTVGAALFGAMQLLQGRLF